VSAVGDLILTCCVDLFSMIVGFHRSKGSLAPVIGGGAL
jgi:hypothetical protein